LIIALMAVGSFAHAQQTDAPENEAWVKEYLKHLRHEKWRPATNMEGVNLQGRDQVTHSKTAGSGEIKLTGNNTSDEAEPFIMVNPNDSMNLVASFMDFTGGALVFPIYYTMDGGQTWNLSNFNTVDSLTTWYPGRTIGGGGDPVFAFDNNGRLYFSWIYLSQDPNQSEDPFDMFWAWSDDKGQSWHVADSSKRRIGNGSLGFGGLSIGNDGDGIFDRQWFAVDNSGGANDGNLYCSYLFVPNQNTSLPGDGMCVRRMQAGALEWDSLHVKVSQSSSVQFSNIAVDGNGNVHVSFGTTTQGGTAETVKHVRSTDGGSTWSTPVTVANINYPRPLFTWNVHSRENAAPNMAVDPG
ncbi:MAG: hypothetical protein AAF570_08545, partial [Bacteroidota bacterium]